MTEDGLFVCQAPTMNIWGDDSGEQDEDWSGGGALTSPEIVEYPDLKKVTGQSRHGIFFIHDVEEEA